MDGRGVVHRGRRRDLVGDVAWQRLVGRPHNSLKSQLSPLFGADWSGTASAQFSALYEKFDQHAKGLNDALAGIGLLLHSAGANYASAEHQIAASFRT